MGHYQKLTRRKGIKWDYNWDGCFARERTTKYWKRYWKRWLRREGKKELETWAM